MFVNTCNLFPYKIDISFVDYFVALAVEMGHAPPTLPSLLLDNKSK